VPLIGTAAALHFIVSDDAQAITQPLRNDVPRPARLKWISSWANGNPFMLSFDSAASADHVERLDQWIYEYELFRGLRQSGAPETLLERATATAALLDGQRKA